MKRIISLVLTFAMITSLFSISVFATNYIVADGTPEKYADMITEAIEKSEYKEEIDIDKVFVVENTSHINMKKGIKPIWVWIALPLKGSSDISYAGFDNSEYLQAITNFVSFSGMEAPHTGKLDELVKENNLSVPTQVTNLWVSERVHVFAYNVICGEKEYIIPYYFTDESSFNKMEDESCAMELGKAYTIDEFISLCEKEAELYAEYIAEQRNENKADSQSSYIDKDGDVVEITPGKKDDEKPTTNESDKKNEKTDEISFNMLTNIPLYDVVSMSIRSGTTGEGFIVKSDHIINDVLDVIDRLVLKEYSTENGSSCGGWSYSVDFELDDKSTVGYTCSTGTRINGKQYEAIDDSELRTILKKYYNLFASIDSSEWAKEEIAVATEYGILSANNSYNYKANIMREEFCDLAVNMMEASGITLSTDNPQRPLGIRDTQNVNVLKLYKAGIIMGKEHDKTGIVFAPTDFITREEAATILGRIATYLNIKSKEDIPYANYSDGSTISDWADVAVHTMYQLGVMKGVSETEFLPKGNYTVEQSIATLVRLYDIVNKAEIKMLDVMQALECDDYNGQVFIDAYPKQWQGFEEKPIASSNGYFNILPGKLLYSYDRETWNVLYEDVDGKRVYSNLPTDVDIEGARYAWEYNCFVNAPFDVNKSYYSYDNKEWFEGTPSKPDFIKECDLVVDAFPYGITKDSIIYDSENKLYISWTPYEVNTYFSERYQTTLSENKHDKIWVSTDGEKWDVITLPEEVLFFTSAGINSQAKAIIIDAAVEFTDEEKEFINAEEEKAKQSGRGYDKPEYKIEKYIVLLSNLRDKMYAEVSKQPKE